MATKKDLKQEKVCYETLFEILDYYAYQRSDFDPVDISASMVINRIKKNLSKCDLDIRLKVLEKILYLTNDRIIAGVGTKTVFYSLDGISIDLIKKVKEERALQELEEKKRQEELALKEEEIAKKVKYLSDRFDTADRDMLNSLSTDANKRIMSVLSLCRLLTVDAYVETLNRLYTGLYGKSKSHLVNELRENGIKVNQDNKISPLMTDDLLKYHLIASFLTLKECEARKDKIIPKYEDKFYNRFEYYNLLREVGIISKTVAKEYEKEFGMTPKTTLLEDPYDRRYAKMLESDQIMFDEIMDDAPIKRVRRDK